MLQLILLYSLFFDIILTQNYNKKYPNFIARYDYFSKKSSQKLITGKKRPKMFLPKFAHFKIRKLSDYSKGFLDYDEYKPNVISGHELKHTNGLRSSRKLLHSGMPQRRSGKAKMNNWKRAMYTKYSSKFVKEKPILYTTTPYTTTFVAPEFVYTRKQNQNPEFFQEIENNKVLQEYFDNEENYNLLETTSMVPNSLNMDYETSIWPDLYENTSPPPILPSQTTFRPPYFTKNLPPIPRQPPMYPSYNIPTAYQRIYDSPYLSASNLDFQKQMIGLAHEFLKIVRNLFSPGDTYTDYYTTTTEKTVFSDDFLDLENINEAKNQFEHKNYRKNSNFRANKQENDLKSQDLPIVDGESGQIDQRTQNFGSNPQDFGFENSVINFNEDNSRKMYNRVLASGGGSYAPIFNSDNDLARFLQTSTQKSVRNYEKSESPSLFEADSGLLKSNFEPNTNKNANFGTFRGENTYFGSPKSSQSLKSANIGTLHYGNADSGELESSSVLKYGNSGTFSSGNKFSSSFQEDSGLLKPINGQIERKPLMNVNIPFQDFTDDNDLWSKKLYTNSNEQTKFFYRNRHKNSKFSTNDSNKNENPRIRSSNYYDEKSLHEDPQYFANNKNFVEPNDFYSKNDKNTPCFGAPCQKVPNEFFENIVPNPYANPDPVKCKAVLKENCRTECKEVTISFCCCPINNISRI